MSVQSEPRQVAVAAALQAEVLESMQTFVAENMLLTPVGGAWQPTDYLPDMRAADWAEQLKAFREPSAELSDEILVVLVGDMVTEEALPGYAVALNLLARDHTGVADTPWARWARGWTAEENRHGDLLNAYLRLTGRVDMRAVEVTIHNLISGGFEPRAHPDLYGGLVYTAFQERATKISHANVGKLVAGAGDAGLTRICRKIAADEARHEAFYTRAMAEVFRLDPEGALATCRSMLRRVIAMPGRRMYDGHDPDLFEHFAAVAQRIGVYTVHDYATIVEHLVNTWEIAALSVGGKAARAQEYLCGLAGQCYKTAEEVGEKLLAEAGTRVAFSWVDGRRV